MTFESFLEYNFAPIIGIIFQIIILCTTTHFSKKDKQMFLAIVVLEILELVTYDIEDYLGNLEYLSIWRYVLSNAGYIIRPMLVYPFIALVRINTVKKDKLQYFDLIPITFVIILYQFSYFTNWVYYFTNDNHFVRGPLGYTSQIVTLFYVAELIYLIIKYNFLKTKFNFLLILIEVLYISLSMILESIMDVKGLGINALVYSTVFYMFALQSTALTNMVDKLTKLSRIDGLSGLLNRSSGEKVINEILEMKQSGAFCIVDIDAFKNINDSYGHSVGDEAIIKVSEIISDFISKDSIGMRLGGDEFAVWTPNFHNYDDISVIIEKMLLELDNVRLSADPTYHIHASIGICFYDGSYITNFDELYRKADQKLYVAKTYDGNSYIA